MQETSFKQKIILIIFSIFLSVILLETGLRIGGFIILSFQEHRNMISLKQKDAYYILCLGESTTAFGGRHSWPSQLEEILNEKNMSIKFKIINKGYPGANSAFILSQLNQNLERYKPNMVIAMMGINDTKHITDTIGTHDRQVGKIKLFLRSFRIYKLARLIRIHILNKIREAGVYKPKDAKLNIAAEAEVSFNKQIEINHNNDITYVELGLNYIKEGLFEEAQEAFRRAIEINPNNESAYANLAHCYGHYGGMFKEAVEIVRKAIKLNPTNASLYEELGYDYYNMQMYQEAEEAFGKAMEIDPNIPTLYFSLGQCYISQDKFQRAEGALKKALRINPENYGAYTELGNCYISQQRYKEAEIMYKKAIEINPYQNGVYAALERCYERQNINKFITYNNLVINYGKIKDVIVKKNIRLVCVQYPTLSLEPLTSIFDSVEGIIFCR